MIIEALPGKGLRAFYVPANAGAAVALAPDILDTDWERPFFHHSVVEHRGAWVDFPKGLFLQAHGSTSQTLASARP